MTGIARSIAVTAVACLVGGCQGVIGAGNTPAADGGDPGMASDSDTPRDGGGDSSGDAAGDASGDPAAGDTPVTANPTANSPYILVDQFGYLPTAQKVAVIRDPQSGFDAADSFTPGTTYQVINTTSLAVVFSGAPTAWNGGATDGSSGDRAWWFDFSSVTTAGTYVVHDVDNTTRSTAFRIADDVYVPVLRHAFRTFFYQRVGFAKQTPYAEAAWSDGASHIGAGQDSEARSFFDPGNAGTERDLSGGWYDAGDYNKYTNWTANYVIALLHTYLQRPSAWGDDFGLPESGNGISDILDEVKWGMDHLVRMQNPDGSVLSIVGLDHASPPSAATGASYYGNENTSATLTTAAAYALGSTVFASLGISALDTYAADLLVRAEQAWLWAEVNPNVLFRNNDGSNGSSGLGAGQQETDDAGRAIKKLEAAVYLFEATGTAAYTTYVEGNYGSLELVQSSWVNPFRGPEITSLLYYAALPAATTAVATTIRDRFSSGMNAGHMLGSISNATDPYRAHLNDYTWGSNSTKSMKGNLFQDLVTFGLTTDVAGATGAAAGFLHYLHGVNPIGLAYLTNMSSAGAERSATSFYHSWFSDGHPDWDAVGVSTYGPAPGYLTGGPNPYYSWDGCCPSSCGVSCGGSVPTPPSGQPAQKAYLDFNTSWPLNSWEVTENSCGYQVQYLRLISKFVP